MKTILALTLALSTMMATCHVRPVEERPKPQTTTIFLVRHAEKDKGRNPPLTTAGQERAQHLAEILAKENLDAIYSTNYLRTQQTAQPTAAAQGLAIQDYDPGDLPAFAEQLLRGPAGRRILIVGHSNTTPVLAGLLTDGEAQPHFSEDDYGNLLIVNRSTDGAARCLNLRF